jgi:geranylgeranyl transferase type-1 subunit beta
MSPEELRNEEGAKLDTAKHLVYHQRCLQLLPTQFQGNDLNRMSLAFFTLNALDIFGALKTLTTPTQREHWITWIYACQLPTGGFRGSPATNIGSESVYDAMTVPSTYFALATLLILGDDLGRVERGGALAGVKAAQNEDGSFAPVLAGGARVGEVDVRHSYCAAAVRCMLSPFAEGEDIDVAAAVHYIQSCKVSLLLATLMIGIRWWLQSESRYRISWYSVSQHLH